jgi:signal transduction histidine kinase
LNELLTFEKLAAGLQRLELAPTAIHLFVKEMVQEFNIPANAKEIALEIIGESETPLWANFDRARMALVLRNFLSNAVKFTPKGGAIGVIISVVNNNEIVCDDNLENPISGLGRVKITVKDSGAGLTSENVDKLFQEGVQFNADTLQGGGGSGFGLFIAKGRSIYLHVFLPI